MFVSTNLFPDQDTTNRTIKKAGPERAGFLVAASQLLVEVELDTHFEFPQCAEFLQVVDAAIVVSIE